MQINPAISTHQRLISKNDIKSPAIPSEISIWLETHRAVLSQHRKFKIQDFSLSLKWIFEVLENNIFPYLYFSTIFNHKNLWPSPFKNTLFMQSKATFTMIIMSSNNEGFFNSKRKQYKAKIYLNWIKIFFSPKKKDLKGTILIQS